jgi:hypothetical protein
MVHFVSAQRLEFVGLVSETITLTKPQRLYILRPRLFQTGARHRDTTQSSKQKLVVFLQDPFRPV